MAKCVLVAMGKKAAARYPVGSLVSVHYNPVEPADAILEV